jgi:hypothetical protein
VTATDGTRPPPGRPLPPPTLGPVLAGEARLLAARRLPRPGWLGELAPLLRQVRALPVPAQERFRRVEARVPAPGLAAGPKPGHAGPVWPAPAGGTGLPPDVRGRLRDAVGPEAESIRVHHGPAADAAARAHRADAVTLAQDVFVRDGRLDPRGPAGFALLVHEATHAVSAIRPGSAWRRATGAGAAEEEQLARDRERAALAGPAYRPARSAPAAPPAPPVPALGGGAPPTARPMAAAADRDLGAPPAPPAGPDLDRLRDALYRDLLRQLRVERERGA